MSALLYPETHTGDPSLPILWKFAAGWVEPGTDRDSR